MNLDQITTKCWILALFIRDDGERLLLGDGWFDFKDSLQHFQPNTIANDIVELQGTDGQLLAGQVRRSASQSFDGYVGDALTSKTEIENRRRQFIQFFRTRRHYKVIYIFPDGTAIQRRMGYLTDAPSVPEMWQKFPEYHVALNFEDVNYYEYAEDAQGDEIYAHDSLVKLISVQSGGLVWDEIGAVSHGYTWLDPQTVTGDYITVTDGATGSPLTLSQLTGNATQNGTPTPDAPVSIETVTGEQTVKVTNGSDSQSQEINLGKNLLTPRTGATQNGMTGTVNADGSIHITGTATAGWANIVIITSEYLPSGTYTFSTSNDNLPCSIECQLQMTDNSWLTMNNRPIGVTPLVPTRTYTLPIKTIRINTASMTIGDSYDFTIYPMIQAGSTATTYAPYFPPIELAKIGTYQDRIYKDDEKWYVEKQVGKVVLDGSESYAYSSGNNWAYFYFATIGAGACDSNSIGISNNFTRTTINSMASDTTLNGVFAISADKTYFAIRNTTLTSKAEYNTWLSAHNTTVYYALATPTTTEITDETLLAQLNFIASLYGGVNNISIVPTGGAQGEMTLNYYADVDATGAGYEWEAGEGGGPTIVQVIGVDNAQPIWTVTGPATNPTLTNITTVQTITWNGTVPNGQKLIVDMANQTATLAGANVYEFITGSWITLRPGANKLTYSAQGADQASQIQWNGVVG